MFYLERVNMYFFKLDLTLNDLLQKLRPNGFSSVCIKTCDYKYIFCENCLLKISEAYGTSFKSMNRCFFK